MSTRSSPASSATAEAGARALAFAPVARPDARLLVLGSLPGAVSLARGEYYAHPRNAFWRLMGAVLGRDDLPQLAYPERLAALVAAGVALDDVVASARRRGSLDGAIREAGLKDLAAMIGSLPELRAVAFNGRKAATLGRRALAGAAAPVLVDLPSSSPANARLGFAEKRAVWLELRRYLPPMQV